MEKSWSQFVRITSCSACGKVEMTWSIVRSVSIFSYPVKTGYERPFSAKQSNGSQCTSNLYFTWPGTSNPPLVSSPIRMAAYGIRKLIQDLESIGC